MRMVTKRNGFIEYYMVLFLFLCVCTGTAWVGTLQIQKIQLEKSAWQTQAQVWQSSKLFERVHDETRERILDHSRFGVNEQFRLSASDGVLDTHREESFTNTADLLYDVVRFAMTTAHCGEMAEPGSFIAMKELLYRHSHQSLYASQEIEFGQTFSSFLPHAQEQTTIKSRYTHVNRPFNARPFRLSRSIEQLLDGLNSDEHFVTAGFLNRQAMWQEAMYRSDTYPPLLPLQAVIAYEVVMTAVNVRKIKAPVKIPWVRKRIEKGVQKLADRIMENAQAQMAQPLLENIENNMPPLMNRHETCNSIHERESAIESTQGTTRRNTRIPRRRS